MFVLVFSVRPSIASAVLLESRVSLLIVSEVVPSALAMPRPCSVAIPVAEVPNALVRVALVPRQRPPFERPSALAKLLILLFSAREFVSPWAAMVSAFVLFSLLSTRRSLFLVRAVALSLDALMDIPLPSAVAFATLAKMPRMAVVPAFPSAILLLRDIFFVVVVVPKLPNAIAIPPLSLFSAMSFRFYGASIRLVVMEVALIPQARSTPSLALVTLALLLQEPPIYFAPKP